MEDSVLWNKSLTFVNEYIFNEYTYLIWGEILANSLGGHFDFHYG